MAYNGYFVGQNMVYFFITMFLSVYYVDSLGIPVAIVGAIFLGARVWDAVNDPLLSILIEKARFKGGKFKPWINVVAILVPIATVLVFSFTGFLAEASLAVKVVYATVTYVVWGMLYTISDAPAFALATVMTPNLSERNVIISYSKMFTFFGIMIAVVLATPLTQSLGWFWAALVLSLISMALMLLIRKCKERVVSTQETPTLKQIISAITKNKYLVIYVICTVIAMGFSFGLTITPLLAKDVFNDPNLATILLLSSMVPVLIVAPFIPRIIDKIGKVAFYKICTIATIVLSVVSYFVGYSSLAPFLVISIIKAVVGGATMIMPALFFSDCIEYYYYTTGERYEAASFAANTFTNKACGAIAGAGAMLLLAAFGYVESVAGQTVVQTQRVVDGMWLIYNIGPAVGATIALIIFWVFYDLTDAKLQMYREKSVAQY